MIERTVPEFIFVKLARNPSNDIVREYNEIGFMPRKAVRIILPKKDLMMEEDSFWINRGNCVFEKISTKDEF